jgi:hypothetical protein
VGWMVLPTKVSQSKACLFLFLCSQDAGVDAEVGPPLYANHEGKDVAVLFFIVGGNEAGLFKLGICNGQVRLVRAGLNYNERSTYVLSVETRSNGLLTSATTANITITVINVPDVPVFNETSCVRSVNETSPIGTVFSGGPVSAYDVDGRSLFYFVNPNRVGSDMAAITDASGPAKYCSSQSCRCCIFPAISFVIFGCLRQRSCTA